MSPHAAVFGKLPSHGDFVARGMEPAAREAWDGWISEGLARARERLGDGFEAAHDTAPPWRFVDGPGPLGDSWRAGALAASIDRAQRRFVIVAMADGLEAEDAAARGGELAEGMEQAIYDAFAGGWDVDRLASESEDITSSAHPRESGDPGVFSPADSSPAPEEKTWIPAFAGMSGVKMGGAWWSDDGEIEGPAPDIWSRMFPPASAEAAA